MLGYCMACDKLVSIRVGEQQWGSRQCNYYPISHWILIHEPCGRVVNEADFNCCNVPFHHAETKLIQCPGEKKAIK